MLHKLKLSSADLVSNLSNASDLLQKKNKKLVEAYQSHTSKLVESIFLEKAVKISSFDKPYFTEEHVLCTIDPMESYIIYLRYPLY